nr:protein kinase [Streptomyces sp. NRRL S-455]
MNGATLPLRIGPYLVERRLGSGGMGEVYLAYSVAGEPVAVKVIRPDRTDPHTRARFEREATIARTISGTGRVARFIDADPFAEQPWLAMDYVPGRPLSDVVRDQGPLTAPLVASLGALLAEGLAAVHTAGLLHRDLKAQNVILSDFGPVIIDFGLGAFFGASKGSLTQAGAVIGTVRCMPPEQALGELDVTQAADVYGLGTVLLYSATGHYPYDGARWEAVAAQVVNSEIGPDLSGLPDELAPVVTAMLAHKAEDRPSLEEVTRQCADLQRIYDRQVTLSTVGVNIRGRSSKLTLSYRTTQEILDQAAKVVHGSAYDDLDDGTDTLDGYHSLLRGPAPEFIACADWTDEIARLAEALKQWRADITQPTEDGTARDPSGTMAVCVADGDMAGRVAADLEMKHGITTATLTKDGPQGGGEVHIGTMHRFKGLEYQKLAVIGASDGILPRTALIEKYETTDPKRYERELKKSRNQLFVATTRARDALRISWHGKPSPFLPLQGKTGSRPG